MYLRKCSKFDVDFKNAQKNREKGFYFCDKCLGFFRIESFLLRRQYLSSTVNMLRKSLENLHVIRSDFFQVNYLHGDQ